MCIATRNTHVQYDCPICFGSKVMTKVKIFENWVKSQGQGHRVKAFDTNRKVLPQGTHNCNMTALSLLVIAYFSFESYSQG